MDNLENKLEDKSKRNTLKTLGMSSLYFLIPGGSAYASDPLFESPDERTRDIEEEIPPPFRRENLRDGARAINHAFRVWHELEDPTEYGVGFRDYSRAVMRLRRPDRNMRLEEEVHPSVPFKEPAFHFLAQIMYQFDSDSVRFPSPSRIKNEGHIPMGHFAEGMWLTFDYFYREQNNINLAHYEFKKAIFSSLGFDPEEKELNNYVVMRENLPRLQDRHYDDLLTCAWATHMLHFCRDAFIIANELDESDDIEHITSIKREVEHFFYPFFRETLGYDVGGEPSLKNYMPYLK